MDIILTSFSVFMAIIAIVSAIQANNSYNKIKLFLDKMTKYYQVKDEQQKKNEDMQASYGSGLIGANFLNQGLGAAQATPEYMAKEVARKEAVAQLMAEAEKATA